MNLFATIANENEAPSYYRGLFPLAALRNILPQLKVTRATNAKITIGDLLTQDVCFILRPTGRDHVDLIQLCKTIRLKVWIDLDDLLLDVPESNPAAALYSQPDIKKSIIDCISSADIISVSTEYLAKSILPYVAPGTSIHVIPNALNDYLYEPKSEFKWHNIASWRGTSSHQEDLLAFSKQIVEASAKNPSWLFNFMGYKPWYLLKELGKRGQFTPPCHIFKYFQTMKEIFPAITYVTQSKSDFNRCKSNIAWIEGTWAGSVSLGPDFEEWHKPGIINYSTPEGFGHHLQDLLKMNRHYLSDLHAMSWSYIKTHLLLSHVNHKRAQILSTI